MNFSNQTVLSSELPRIEDIHFKPLERDYLKVSYISTAITLLVFLIAGIVAFKFIDKLHEPLLISGATLIFFLFSAFLFMSIHLNYKFSGYTLREKDILFRSGWLVRRTRIVMLNRIQHVSVQSGPLERKFGLASVSIYTAGASNADFTIKGITETTAAQIKEWISEQLHGGIH